MGIFSLMLPQAAHRITQRAEGSFLGHKQRPSILPESNISERAAVPKHLNRMTEWSRRLFVCF